MEWRSGGRYVEKSLNQAGYRVYQMRASNFMRTLAKSSKVWRTLADPQRHVHKNHPDIHQSSGEGAFCMWVAFRICPIKGDDTISY